MVVRMPAVRRLTFSQLISRWHGCAVAEGYYPCGGAPVPYFLAAGWGWMLFQPDCLQKQEQEQEQEQETIRIRIIIIITT